MIHMTPSSLLDRFPYWQREIRLLVEKDPGFRQLSDDYDLLLQSLNNTAADATGEREEIIGLKTSLEVEALEMLSQTRER